MSTMNHSILDGTPALTTAHPDTSPVSGRTRVRACMSRPGIAVTPGTDFATVVAAITASRRGILPVVTADGTVVGVVAASDLLAAYADEHAGRAVRGELHAQDLMTAPAVTVTDEQSVTETVALLRRESLHHLPVVDGGGRLVGLVSPHDLLDALRRDDEAVRTEALAIVLTPGSGIAPASARVTCERGHVVLHGRTRTRSDAAAICLQVARIDGLTGLSDRLGWDTDDTTPPAAG
ncbi:CBS domain-containing protein [Kitasatospora sp. RG8]|uniref:CBS domain-containing protein n=1 Tax=Kitasatospora sp. RG8 TaxID=2820815 RepID=UPI001ADEF3B9|nr:CBS domain-containing protein [Kitasatospora sp. RG8]MBP0450603.1 CBS domain-containing protein [Kitasatospora sp. RG8]